MGRRWQRPVLRAQTRWLADVLHQAHTQLGPDRIPTFGPGDRADLVDAGGTYRKAARVVAVRMTGPFEVETDHGVMQGAAGDWLVTNHPDDDSSSDVWPVSEERFAASYGPASNGPKFGPPANRIAPTVVTERPPGVYLIFRGRPDLSTSSLFVGLENGDGFGISEQLVNWREGRTGEWALGPFPEFATPASSAEPQTIAADYPLQDTLAALRTAAALERMADALSGDRPEPENPEPQGRRWFGRRWSR